MASLSLDSPEEVSGNSNLTLSTQSVVTSMCMKIWQQFDFDGFDYSTFDEVYTQVALLSDNQYVGSQIKGHLKK
ncbi:hypothetical protein H5410_007274 [Solanum commersonii]|uniref:Uncharacterized protein n=1 Tax=Solanum commersonii TaxID=4109 RepID=A0A9J6AC08_SOLCO|nr:hypothetical protein H5410_007274 [Solanum commersonii]